MIRFYPYWLSILRTQIRTSVPQFKADWLVDVSPWAIASFNAHASTPIDMFSLFEKTTLHELRHTQAGGALIDVSSAHGVNVVGPTGWLHVRSLGALAWRSAEANSYHGPIGWLIQNMEIVPLLNRSLVRITQQAQG